MKKNVDYSYLNACPTDLGSRKECHVTYKSELTLQETPQKLAELSACFPASLCLDHARRNLFPCQQFFMLDYDWQDGRNFDKTATGFSLNPELFPRWLLIRFDCFFICHIGRIGSALVVTIVAHTPSPKFTMMRTLFYFSDVGCEIVYIYMYCIYIYINDCFSFHKSI